MPNDDLRQTFRNPAAEDGGESTEGQRASRNESIDRGASRQNWRVPLPAAVSREHAQEHELERLFELLHSMADYLARQMRGNGPGHDGQDDLNDGIPKDNFRKVMQHLGLVLTDAEITTMISAADHTGLQDNKLQVDEFKEMTADAQRDIHDGDHVRSHSMLWRLVYGRLKLVDDARQMREKVLGLRPLFGLEETYGNPGGEEQTIEEGLKVAAQLVFDVNTNRNIYHRLNEAGRMSYLRLHRFRHVFAAAVWTHMAVGWVEDNSKQDHEWFADLHYDGPLFFLVPALEVFLLTPVHLCHCYLRKEASVHWKADRWLLGKLICVAFIVCDAVHEMMSGRNTAPVSRLARPFLLLDLYSTVRSLHQQCFAALASLKELMWLALVFLFFFVLAGMMMYPSPSDNINTDSDGNVHGVRGTSQGAVVFTDLWSRVANLVYLTFGAVNYPDIMLPSYVEDGAPALFYFLPAIVVFLFLFLNIVLAVVYNGYTGDRDEHMVQSTAKRCVGLTLAFRGLTAHGGDRQRDLPEIDRNTFNKFVKAYRRIENDFANLMDTNEEPRDHELNALWTELQPQKRTNPQGDDQYEYIGPFEFLRLPALLAARRFREGPQWALSGANCEIADVHPEDVYIIDGGRHQAFKTVAEIKALEGKTVVVDKVRGWVGGPKLLTCKLQKHRSIAQMHGDTDLKKGASTPSPRHNSSEENAGALTRTSTKNAREARKTCWVKGFPQGTTEDAIKEKFRAYGQVVAITIRRKDSDDGSWAFVTFSRSSEASKAIAAAKKDEIVLGTKVKVKAVEIHRLAPDDRNSADQLVHRSTATTVPDQDTALKLDWSTGVPLVWRRPSDIHETAELVTFTGDVTEVTENEDSGTFSLRGTFSLQCGFEGQAKKSDKSAKVVKSDKTERSSWDKFLRGGLRPGLRKFLLRPYVNAVTIWVILISLVFTFVQYLYRDEHTHEEQQRWHAIDYCITLFFVCELAAKILAFGLVGYWKSTWHFVDLVITTATVVSTASLIWNPSRSNVPEHRYWMLFKLMRAFRVFRLLRLLSAMESRKDAMDKYHLIFAVTTHAAGAMRDFFFYVIAVFYVYSIIGIDLFGGIHGVTQGKSKSCMESYNMPNPILEGTGFDGAGYTSIGLCYDDNRTDNWGDSDQVVASYYYGMNFDDMSDAFVTLLHMLIMNNWHVTHEACVAVFEDNAKLCSDYGANTTLAYKICDNLHSRWVVSAYFYSFEFYVALVLVNILMSFFLDLYGFMWDKYTEHFEESRHQNAHRNILHMVDTLADVANDAKNGGRDHKRCLPGRQEYCGLLPSCCTAGSKTCAGCLLSDYIGQEVGSEPAVKDIRRTHVPLFVPSYGMFAEIAAFDAVNLCQACRRYWSAIEMLTVQHGTISGLDQSITEAMSQGSIQEQRLDMELKVRIMLKLADTGKGCYLPVVPIRPGNESDQ